MSTYTRVRYTPVEGRRPRSVYLRDIKDVTLLGRPCVSGIEVNREGDAVGSDKVDERVHIIERALIDSLTPMRMNNFYCELEEIP